MLPAFKYFQFDARQALSSVAAPLTYFLQLFLVSVISSDECNDKQVILTKKEAAYVSTQLASSCPSLRHLTFKVSQGQTMNISLSSFSGERGSELGSVTDNISGNIVPLVTQERLSHVMTSVGSEVKVKLDSSIILNERFLLEFSGTFLLFIFKTVYSKHKCTYYLI